MGRVRVGRHEHGSKLLTDAKLQAATFARWTSGSRGTDSRVATQPGRTKMGKSDGPGKPIVRWTSPRGNSYRQLLITLFAMPKEGSSDYFAATRGVVHGRSVKEAGPTRLHLTVAARSRTASEAPS